MNQDEIEQLIRTALLDAAVELTDTAGDRDHYTLRVTSSAFAGKSRVAQHQMIYTALGAAYGHDAACAGA